MSDHDEVQRLAATIRRQPGWHAQVKIVLTLPESQEQWTGGYAVVARFEGSWDSYIVRSFEEWAILQRQLADGTIQ